MQSRKAPPLSLAVLQGVCEKAKVRNLSYFRRTKAQSRSTGLSIITDVFETPGSHEPAPASPDGSSGSQTPLSPSPPASEHSLDAHTPDDAPFMEHIALWIRDVGLPAGPEANLEAATITYAPNGARVAQGAQGRRVLLTADATEMRSPAALNDLICFGISRYATRLAWDGAKQKLVRTRMGGKKVTLRSGNYAFVIDQSGDLLLSLAASAQAGAPAGAHLNLAAGLPVLFAGELTVQDEKIISYTPQSGSYRTPSSLRAVAQEHPLLSAAQLQAQGMWPDL